MSNVETLCAARGHRRLSALRTNIAADIRRFQHKSPENLARGDSIRTRLGALATPQLMCLVVHRFGHMLHARGWRGLARAVSGVNLVVFKVNISPGSCIGAGCFMPHPAGVTFHGVAGEHVTFYTQSTCIPRGAAIGAPVERGPRLGDRALIGGGAVVEGAVTIGDDVKVAPMTRLDRDVPAGAIVVSGRLRSAIGPPPNAADHRSPAAAPDHRADGAEKHAEIEPD